VVDNKKLREVMSYLGKKRWKGKSKEEISAHMSRIAKKASNDMTAEERSERSRAAVRIRWAKKRKKKI